MNGMAISAQAIDDAIKIVGSERAMAITAVMTIVIMHASAGGHELMDNRL